MPIAFLASLLCLVIQHDTLIALAAATSRLPLFGRARLVSYRALANGIAAAAHHLLPPVGATARVDVLVVARTQANTLIASVSMTARFALNMRRGPAPTLDHIIAAWRALPREAWLANDLARYIEHGYPESLAVAYLRGAVWSSIETDSVCPDATWVLARAAATALSLRYLALAEAVAHTDVVDCGDTGVAITLPCDDPRCPTCRAELDTACDARRDAWIDAMEAEATFEQWPSAPPVLPWQLDATQPLAFAGVR